MTWVVGLRAPYMEKPQSLINKTLKDEIKK